MKIVIFGLSITSSWGNGHATTYRGLVRELAKLGHEILFLERDVPWYATSRDLPSPPYCRTVLYNSVGLLLGDYGREIMEADCVIVGSYVPDGIEIGRWVTRKAKGITAFYDIDTPVTLAKLERGDCEYLTPELIPIYRLYLSFTGGPILERIREQYGAREAVPLYCSVDPEIHYPVQQPAKWDLGYLGTYSTDRQPPLERMLCEPATLWKEGRFIVAGAQYPAGTAWPDNMKHIEHLPPEQHREFYTAQRFTLNITRKYMIQAGYSPSVRLFERPPVPCRSSATNGPELKSSSSPARRSFWPPQPKRYWGICRNCPMRIARPWASGLAKGYSGRTPPVAGRPSC